MQKRTKSESLNLMTVTTTPTLLGRKPKSTQGDIIPVAWELFERFNYFPTKEALLYPAVDEYMSEFTRVLLERPAGEALFASLEHALLHCRDKQLELGARFNPGPVVTGARLGDAAIRYTRDVWAAEMENAVAIKLADQPGGAVLAGYVGALAAQVWTEMTKHMKSVGPDADFDDALAVAMASLRRLFT